MVAPTVRDSTTAVTLGGTSCVVNKPAGTIEFDKMYLFATTTTGQTVTPPSPFAGNEVASVTVGVNITRLYEATAGASEPSTYTYGLSTTGNVELMLVTVMNARVTGSALNVAVSTNSGASATTQTCLGVTTDADECLLLAFAGIQAVSDFTANGGLTEIEDGTFTTVAYDEAPTAGATGDRTFTSTASNIWLTLLAAIEPEPPINKRRYSLPMLGVG